MCLERRDAYGGGSIMVWAGITDIHKTDVVFVDGRLTGVRNRDEILNRYVVPFIQRHGEILQQDNVLPWPALSADMSPKEHLWDVLGRQLRQRCQQPRTLKRTSPGLSP